MFGVLVPIIAITFSFGVPALVIIILAVLWHRQRIEMIRSGINPNTQSINYPGKKSLLWGLLLTMGGIAFIIYGFTGSDHDISGFGLFLAGAGIALLVYWKMTEPDRERARRLYEEHFMTPPADQPSPSPIKPQNPGDFEPPR